MKDKPVKYIAVFEDHHGTGDNPGDAVGALSDARDSDGYDRLDNEDMRKVRIFEVAREGRAKVEIVFE